MTNGSGVSRGDRNRNARLGRLRALVPIRFARQDRADRAAAGVGDGLVVQIAIPNQNVRRSSKMNVPPVPLLVRLAGRVLRKGQLVPHVVARARDTRINKQGAAASRAARPPSTAT